MWRLCAAAAIVLVAVAVAVRGSPAPQPLWKAISDEGIQKWSQVLQAAAERGGASPPNAAVGQPGYEARVDDLMAAFEAAPFADKFDAARQQFDALTHRVHELSAPQLRGAVLARQSASCDVRDGRVATLRGSAHAPAAWRAVGDADVVLLPLSAVHAAYNAAYRERAAQQPLPLVDALDVGARHAPSVRAVVLVVPDDAAPPPQPHVAMPDELSHACVLVATEGAAAAATATRTLSVRVRAELASVATWNVLLRTKAGNASNTIVMGAHLDSVRAGPGANDDASGSALTLAAATALATAPDTLAALKNQVLFAWWGAEEIGLVGSRYFVARARDSADPLPLADIAVNINNDMVASPNYFRGVYSVTSSTIPRPVRDASNKMSGIMHALFDNELQLLWDDSPMSGSSGTDVAPFLREGVPATGGFTGTSTRKTAAQAQRFGGTAGAPYDACYHRACDTWPDNIDHDVHLQLTQGSTHVLDTLARMDDLRAWLADTHDAAAARAASAAANAHACTRDYFRVATDDDNALFL